MAKVEIFTTSWCPYSRKALEFLKEMDVEFKNYDITDNDEELRQKIGETYNIKGEVTVPQIVVDGRLIGGYDDLIELHSKGEFLPMVGK